MSFYDEQIRQRIRCDDDAFADAFADMASVVMGERLARAMEDNSIQVKNAIEAVLKYYRIKPVDMPDNIKDVNDQLDFLLRPAGIMRRPVDLKDGWWKDAVGAFLAVRKEDGLTVALLPDKIFGYQFLDPRTEKLVRVNHKTAALFETEALCFYKPFPLKALGPKDLFVYAMGCLSRSDLAALYAFSMAVTLLGFLTPKLTNLIYAHVITDQTMTLFFAVFTCMFCVTISQTLLDTIKSLITSRSSTRLSNSVQAAGMMRVLSLPSTFFRKYNVGELSTRIDCITSVCTSVLSVTSTTILTSLLSLTYIIQMFQYGPGLVIPAMLVIAVTVAWSVVQVLTKLNDSRTLMKYSAQENGLSYSLVSGVQKIKLAGAEKRAFAKWAGVYAKYVKIAYDPGIKAATASAISIISSVVIYYFVIETGVGLADYYSFSAAYGLVSGAFLSLTNTAVSFAAIIPRYEMAKPLLETVPEISENKKSVTKLTGGIELSHVMFHYTESGPYIIDDLSLKIRPGQYVAIVGRTGCGKSTLMRILLGFETPNKGAVYYDGKDLASLDVKSVRRNIGTVLQDGKLFNGDIYSNIVIAAPQLSMDAAWQAAELAGIADDIRDMPMGMHTMIAEGSGGISGGQRQRLMIARAIAPKPKILMFDEATSALDNITQRQVSESLDSLKCTRIVIAHRLSTIRHCDRILVLDKGHIVEDGTYEELMARQGFFTELVKRQQPDGEIFEPDSSPKEPALV